MEVNTAKSDYQVWVYDKNFDVISAHKLIADECSQADAVEICNRKNTKATANYIAAANNELQAQPNLSYHDLPQLNFYIRQFGEPTYILYVNFPDGKRVLQELCYHKEIAKEKYNNLVKVTDYIASSTGKRIKPELEERDDSEDRNERRPPTEQDEDNTLELLRARSRELMLTNPARYLQFAHEMQTVFEFLRTVDGTGEQNNSESADDADLNAIIEFIRNDLNENHENDTPQ